MKNPTPGWPAPYAHTFEIFKDARHAGGWRWRLRAKNGKLVATAGESFATKASAKRAARAVARKAAGANVVEI